MSSEASSSSDLSLVCGSKPSDSVRKIKRCRLALESPSTFAASASVARMTLHSPDSAMDTSTASNETPFKLPSMLSNEESSVGAALSFSLCSSPSSPSCSSPNLSLICTPPALKLRDPNTTPAPSDNGKRKSEDNSPTPKKATFFVGGKENMETPRINNQHRSNVAAALAAAKNKRFPPTRKMLSAPKRSLHRSMSVTVPPSAGTTSSHASIMRAFSMADNKLDLTGDKRYEMALPLLKTGLKHYDLDTIDCHTLARLMRGEFESKVSSFRIIDARYVYEFEGGHIRGAENFGSWDEKVFFDEFLPPTLGPKSSTGHEDDENDSATTSSESRSILIFHCEFSTARGPSLMRELRSRDRSLNEDVYPALHYPECYLLHKGYEAFFASYPELCEPQAYQTMKDPNFSKEERMFRIKAKSWAAGGAGTIARTGNSSRLLKM